MENTKKQFILRIEGQGEYLQNAHWFWVCGVRGFNENKNCQACFKPRANVFSATNKSATCKSAIYEKAKIGEDYILFIYRYHANAHKSKNQRA